jgi:O-antigen/teichoic acid export membrane protein
VNTLSITIKRLGKNVIFNFLATIALVGTLQLFVYPSFSKEFGPTVFGSMLLMMGIINTVALTIGGALDNIRLINNQDYVEQNVQGDFRVILEYASFFGIIIITLLTLLLSKYGNLFDLIYIVIITLLTILRSYIIVEYRIRMNFVLVFWYNITVCMGYIIGAMISFWIGIWQIAFICGELFALIFALFTTDILREPRTKTKLFSKTLVGFIHLVISAIIVNALIYLDRFLIYPFMGGNQVAVFFAASMIGKLVGMAFQPISGVMLSYFAQNKKRMQLKDFWTFNLVVLAISAIFYVACLYFAPGVIGMLYPNLIEDALKILPIANLAAIIATIGSLTQPILLRFSPTYWQVVIQIIFGATYIFSGIILLNMYGLYGFCIATLLSSVIRLIIMWIVGSFSLSGKN